MNGKIGTPTNIVKTFRTYKQKRQDRYWYRKLFLQRKMRDKTSWNGKKFDSQGIVIPD
jgi:hypothetical protein